MSKRMISDLEGLPEECWPKVMESARRVFKKKNKFGVFAMEIGPRRVRGLQTDQITLVTYIERKERKPPKPVPAVEFVFERRSFSIHPDVVATGHRAVTHDGWQPLFTGLHPGAQIIADIGEVKSVGAVSILLETEGLPKYLVTAGHLFPEGADGLPIMAASYEDQAPLEIGRVSFNLLDQTVPNLSTEVKLDVAVIELGPEGVQLAQQTASNPRLPWFGSVVPLAGLGGVEAQAYLPVEHEYSSIVKTQQRLFSCHINSPQRGDYTVTDVIQTSQQITMEGDSGTVLFSHQHPSVAVGGCVGAIPNQSSLFEPFDRSLRAIRRVTGEPFRLWHGDNFGGDE